MIVRQFASRQLRGRALFTFGQHAKHLCRAFATEIEQNEALLARQLDEAALAGSTQFNNGGGAPALPARRLRRKAQSQSLDPVVEDYLAFKHMQRTSGKYGSSNTGHYAPWTLLASPPRPSDVTLELLLASQTHLGHSTSLWNPANSRYIFGIREGIHIISLDVTAAHLRRAARVVSGVVERGGLVLFVGTRAGFDRCVVRAAQLAGGCHLFERWTPGSITNGQQILGKCKMKVVDEHDREVPGFAQQLHDRSSIKPDLVVVLNPLENRVLLSECALVNIPTIGIIDTDANPTWVTYPIPANDDSLRSVQVIAGVLGRAGQEGRERRLEAARQGRITFMAPEGLQVPVDWEEQQEAQAALDSHTTTEAPVSAESQRDHTQDPALGQFSQNPTAALSALVEKLDASELAAFSKGEMGDKELLSALEQRLTPEEIEFLRSVVQEDGAGDDGVAAAAAAADGDVSIAEESMGVNPRAREEEIGKDGLYDKHAAEDDLEGTSSHVR